MNVCFLQIETLNNKASEEGEGRAAGGEWDMASSIAQIMQSMRPEYIILSCWLKGGRTGGRGLVKRDWKGQREECE